MKTITLATVLLATMAASSPTWANSGVQASNKLGLKLAKENAKLSKGKNFMLSPVSLGQALTLAANGSAGQTRLEVEQLLSASLASLNEDSAEFVKSLSFSPEQKKELQARFKYANPAVVQIENSIWNTNGQTDGRVFNFSEEFVNTAKNFYGATSQSQDFKTPAAAAAINAWAKEKTYGLVPEIIDADTLNPMLWLVMNASYIEASWKTPFIERQNPPAFKLQNGAKLKVTMLTSSQNISLATLADGSELASIPFNSYQAQAQLSFVIYLPARYNDFSVSQSRAYDVDFWKKAQLALTAPDAYTKAKVTIPKFSFDTSVELKKDLELTKAVGLNFLFQKNANFSALATADSRESIVGLIKQNTRIELDEKGVKAAAVTIVGGMERTSMPAEPQVEFTADRPFVFAIVDNTTKALLFVGSMADPR
ncbi:MAG TPA: serpin family protein [Bacteriovoracaceae bacterium]|nr:serpin family protein [Bacteriovoracaceae bacterium]